MNRFLLALALALCARADTIIQNPPMPGEVILQVTAWDYSTDELGPNWLCCGEASWTADGVIPALEQLEALGVIRWFAFIPCPAFDPCNLTNTDPPGFAPAVATVTPEPAAFVLALIGLCLVELSLSGTGRLSAQAAGRGARPPLEQDSAGLPERDRGSQPAHPSLD